MKIQLYHGTSIANAKEIMRDGFKDRMDSGNDNWKDRMSVAGFVYLTSAYAFYFAQAAAGEEGKATVFRVEVDTDDLYPDEDFLQFFGLSERNARNLEVHQDLADASLNYLGNVAVKPESIKILGGYYRALTDKWFAGEPYEHLSTTDFLSGDYPPKPNSAGQSQNGHGKIER